MTSKDLLITPILLLLIFFIAFFIKNSLSDTHIRKYFLPALFLKIFCAISLGVIYQYYYGSGDTLNYFHHGSQYIWEAFLDNPRKALALIFATGEYTADTYQYASKIWFYDDPSAYFVVKVAGFFDIFTLHTYTATSVLFAVLGFSGVWALFLSFYKLYPTQHRALAIAILFVPSVLFWGSGILKDTLTLSALGWVNLAIVKMFFEKKKIWIYIFILFVGGYVMLIVKIYILLCYVPAVLLWLASHNIQRVRSFFLKLLILPLVLLITCVTGYYTLSVLGEQNKKYALSGILDTAEETSAWLGYVSKVQEGSIYSLGDNDFTLKGVLKKFPIAVRTTLFRPYLWEVKNPVMLLAALESFCFLILTILIIIRSGFLSFFKLIFTQPTILFCFIFSITFAFAIGVSIYNFGSLVRYKIPLLPFYLVGLFLIHYHARQKPAKSIVTS